MKKFILLLSCNSRCVTSSVPGGKTTKTENLENNTEINTETVNKTKKESTAKKDTVIVEVGDEVFSVKEIGDETRIKLGKKEFRVVENDDGVVVFKHSGNDSHNKNHDRFKGHLGGFELGLNSYLTDFWSTNLKPGDNYLNLNTAKSYQLEFFSSCLNIGFTRHFGMAATLGIILTNIALMEIIQLLKMKRRNWPILSSGRHYIFQIQTRYYLCHPAHNTRNTDTSFQQQANNQHRAGVIGAAKLGSHTKVVYYTGGKEKEKQRMISPLILFAGSNRKDRL